MEREIKWKSSAFIEKIKLKNLRVSPIVGDGKSRPGNIRRIARRIDSRESVCIIYVRRTPCKQVAYLHLLCAVCALVHVGSLLESYPLSFLLPPLQSSVCPIAVDELPPIDASTRWGTQLVRAVITCISHCGQQLPPLRLQSFLPFSQTRCVPRWFICIRLLCICICNSHISCCSQSCAKSPVTTFLFYSHPLFQKCPYHILLYVVVHCTKGVVELTYKWWHVIDPLLYCNEFSSWWTVTPRVSDCPLLMCPYWARPRASSPQV